MKKIILIMLTFILGTSIFGATKTSETKNLKYGVVVTNKFKDYSIHTYMAPEEGSFVTSQIIETKNKIVLVDTQFLLPHAEEVKEYIDSLKKPIDRIIISHSHPDHWFGSEVFKGTDIYAIKEVKDEIENMGDFYVNVKQGINQKEKLVPTSKTVPNKILEEGNLTIDGLKLVVKKVKGTESDTITLIEIPKDKVLVAQDVIYNNTHLFIAQSDENKINWINTLKNLDKNKYKLVLGGHGLPATNKVIKEDINYLIDAREALKIAATKKTSQEKSKAYKDYMIGKYPNYKGAVLIDISTGYLFQ